MTAEFVIFKIFILILFIMSSAWAKSEDLILLDLPLYSGKRFSYSVSLENECSFAGVKKISTSDFSPGSGNALLEGINVIQRKINLTIEKSQIEPERILFSIKAASNITFEFSFDKETCTLIKKIHQNNKVTTFNEIRVDYIHALNSPVIKRWIVISEGNNSRIFLYPWALHGQISTYEFMAGPALSIHSNIRKNNLATFEKNDPVIEPIPAFLFRYGTFFLSKDGLGSLIYHIKDFNLVAMGILEGEPYESTGLSERKKGLFLGMAAKYDLVELIYYQDFFHNKGSHLKLTFAPEFYPRTDWKFTPQIFVQYWNHKYVDYYFGVSPSEFASGMPPYQGRSTINFGTMFEAVHYIDKWTFLIDVGVKSYGKEVYASPTVTKQNEIRFIASVLYKFF